MVIKLLKLRLYKDGNTNFKKFMKNFNLEDDTINEDELQRFYIYRIYPRDSTITTNKGFVNIDNGSMGGTNWTCFIVKDNRSYYFESFGGQPDKIST